MLKSEEKRIKDSCWNKTPDDQLVFVLVERDPLFIEMINYWMKRRIECEINNAFDEKILNATELMIDAVRRRKAVEALFEPLEPEAEPQGEPEAEPTIELDSDAMKMRSQLFVDLDVAVKEAVDSILKKCPLLRLGYGIEVESEIRTKLSKVE